MRTTPEFNYTISVEFDDTPVRGNAMASGHADYDTQVEDEILSRLKWNDVWAWAVVTVTASIDGIDLVGTDTLGACTYDDENDFTSGSYFIDMCDESRADLMAKIKAVKEVN